MLKVWESYGIWWVIALSLCSNLVLRAVIRRLGTPQAERSSVLLWAISSALHYLPFVIALGALAAGVLDDLLVLSIELPPTIQQAIQTKLVAEQASLEMQYRISREIQEKERKLIEAEGIERYNLVVRESLRSTDGNDVSSLLKYRGIDATLELARSPNTKVIVVGANDRMPLIMDTSTPPSGVLSFGSASPSPSPSPPAAQAQGGGQKGAPSPTPNK